MGFADYRRLGQRARSNIAVPHLDDGLEWPMRTEIERKGVDVKCGSLERGMWQFSPGNKMEGLNTAPAASAIVAGACGLRTQRHLTWRRTDGMHSVLQSL